MNKKGYRKYMGKF